MDIKEPCVVCGEKTVWACSDCAIDTGKSIHVCRKASCRDAHEAIHPAMTAELINYLKQDIEEAKTVKSEWCSISIAQAESIIAALSTPAEGVDPALLERLTDDLGWAERNQIEFAQVAKADLEKILSVLGVDTAAATVPTPGETP